MADEHPASYPERGEFLPESVEAASTYLRVTKKVFLDGRGSQIDWAGHANDTENTVDEMLDFDRAIKVAFDYADQDPNTLVVITADRETGGMALTGGDISIGEVDATL